MAKSVKAEGAQIVSIDIGSSAAGEGVCSLTVWGSSGEVAEIDVALPATAAAVADTLRKLADAVLEGAG